MGFGTPDQADYEKAVQAALRKTFRPEFLNRLDEVICFTPLSPEQVAKIAQKLLSQTARRLEQKGINLTVLPGALEVLARQGGDVEYGARPLRRYLREELENPTAEALLSGALLPGSTLAVDGDGDHLKLDIRPGMPVPAMHTPGALPS